MHSVSCDLLAFHYYTFIIVSSLIYSSSLLNYFPSSEPFTDTSIRRSFTRYCQMETLPVGSAQVRGYCDPVSCCFIVLNAAACSYVEHLTS